MTHPVFPLPGPFCTAFALLLLAPPIGAPTVSAQQTIVRQDTKDDSPGEQLTLALFLERVERDGRLDARELDELVLLVAKTDERVAAWLASSGEAGLPPGDAPEWLTDSACEWAIANPLVLRAARDAALGRRYEETLAWLAIRDANANPPSKPRPRDGAAIALYYRAVASHQLVRLKEANRTAKTLLALSKNETADRHCRLAELIRRDSDGVDEDSLGYVAKLMGDSRRRLDLGRSGDPERELQKDILDRLDKVIDELEKEQQKQQQQQQSSSGRGSGGAKPLQQSIPAELKGAGDVADRKTPPGGDWGSLPPAERERVTQQVIRDFPGHYRSLIEEYFRSLSEQPEDDAQREAGPR